MALPLQTTLVAFCISERRPQYNKPETNGPNYWATRLQDSITRLSDANYDCFERIQEKFKTDTFLENYKLAKFTSELKKAKESCDYEGNQSFKKSSHRENDRP